MKEIWKYHNHMITSINITQCFNKGNIDKKALWKKYPKAFLIIYISDWDIEGESEWYYVIKDTPIEKNELRKSVKRQIRKGNSNYLIRKIDWKKQFQEMYSVYASACARYKNFKKVSQENFRKGLKGYSGSVDVWGV